MSKLSPAAQAVLDAANGAQSYGPDDCLNESRWIAAAALEAAADQADPKRHIEDISYQHQLYVDGWKDCLEVIRDIAAELKAQ